MRIISEDPSSSIFTVKPVQIFLIILLSAGLLLNVRGAAGFSLLLLSGGGIVWLWGRISLVNVETLISSDRIRMFPDNLMEISIRVKNAKIFPVLIKPDLFIPGSITEKNKKKLINRERILLWYSESVFSFKIIPSKRGVYNLGPLALRGGDIFGFNFRMEEKGENIEIVVYPGIAKIKEIDLFRREYFGVKTGKGPVKDPVLVSGTRDYQSGQSARNIHWKASARYSRLQEKVFEPVEQEKVLIIFDVNDFKKISGGGCFEKSLEVITALIIKLKKRGISSGFITNSRFVKGGQSLIPVSGNVNQAVLILETLARIELIPVSNGKSITDLLSAGRILSYGVSCLYVASGFSGEQVRAASFFRNRKIRYRFIIAEKGINPLLSKDIIYLDDLLLKGTS